VQPLITRTYGEHRLLFLSLLEGIPQGQVSGRFEFGDSRSSGLRPPTHRGEGKTSFDRPAVIFFSPGRTTRLYLPVLHPLPMRGCSGMRLFFLFDIVEIAPSLRQDWRVRCME
jgi:hypothetical protein